MIYFDTGDSKGICLFLNGVTGPFLKMSIYFVWYWSLFIFIFGSFRCLSVQCTEGAAAHGVPVPYFEGVKNRCSLNVKTSWVHLVFSQILLRLLLLLLLHVGSFFKRCNTLKKKLCFDLIHWTHTQTADSPSVTYCTKDVLLVSSTGAFTLSGVLKTEIHVVHPS